MIKNRRGPNPVLTVHCICAASNVSHGTSARPWAIACKRVSSGGWRRDLCLTSDLQTCSGEPAARRSRVPSHPAPSGSRPLSRSPPMRRPVAEFLKRAYHERTGGREVGGVQCKAATAGRDRDRPVETLL